ncbi:MAG: N-formylglutamate amidohydrolase [Candidatus Peribacteraceae bacterium]|jgi:formiminoglutamase|nr:N-formylglutamate amidohydrolase [Candidatus Peribacteraceae bacterium]MDP7477143.1 N-formylglutamate amidohydrolase [Candidatus Peribacteraceae bacterium]
MASKSPRPILVSIPHASSAVPEEVADKIALTAEELLGYTDLFTDEIFDIDNVYKVQSNFSRVIVDPNRAPDDISKEYELAAEGVTVHTTWDEKSVYKVEPDQEVVDALIKNYHDPYHEALEQHIPKVQFLIDCHSFLPFGPKLKKDSGKERPDINLGNMNFSSCTREHTVFFRDFFEERGYKVAINFPYTGKYILGHHCHRRRIPPFLVPGIQIELNQGLYVRKDDQKIPEKVVEFRELFIELVDAFMKKFCPDECPEEEA